MPAQIPLYWDQLAKHPADLKENQNALSRLAPIVVGNGTFPDEIALLDDRNLLHSLEGALAVHVGELAVEVLVRVLAMEVEVFL